MNGEYNIPTVLVDDESNCLSALEQLIIKYCPDIEVVACASTVREAVKKIEEHKPRLVFLDIRMSDGDGFQVLDNVSHKNFEVIFTTAHEEYALKAFEFSAIHYLLKPVDHKALTEAVSRFTDNTYRPDALNHKINLIKENLSSNHKKIILPVSGGFEIYETADIIRCQAEGCYTEIYIKGQKKCVVVSNSIGHYENLLDDLYFVRVHKKHLINMNFVNKFIKSYGGYLQMSDGAEISISERKKSYFQQRLKNFARGL